MFEIGTSWAIIFSLCFIFSATYSRLFLLEHLKVPDVLVNDFWYPKAINLDSSMDDLFHELFIFTGAICIQKKHFILFSLAFKNYSRLTLVLLSYLTELLSSEFHFSAKTAYSWLCLSQFNHFERLSCFAKILWCSYNFRFFWQVLRATCNTNLIFCKVKICSLSDIIFNLL